VAMVKGLINKLEMVILLEMGWIGVPFVGCLGVGACTFCG
jgi:hypothetical protein